MNIPDIEVELLPADWQANIVEYNQHSTDGHVLSDLVIEFRPLEFSKMRALDAAARLKKYLSDNALNIVCAESLTAGMICKTLIDIPAFGAAVYGGFNVYDTDAKRRWLSVRTEGVYSHATAQQMAIGALENSQAMVGLAVTGQAMPFYSEKAEIGHVHVGVALRTSSDIDQCVVKSMELRICDEPGYARACDGWRELTTATEEGLKGLSREEAAKFFAPTGYTSFVADFIRQTTTARACQFAIDVISRHNSTNGAWACMSDTFPSCKPSWIVAERNCSPVSQKTCRSSSSQNLPFRDARRVQKHWAGVDSESHGFDRKDNKSLATPSLKTARPATYANRKSPSRSPSSLRPVQRTRLSP